MVERAAVSACSSVARQTATSVFLIRLVPPTPVIINVAHKVFGATEQTAGGCIYLGGVESYICTDVCHG